MSDDAEFATWAAPVAFCESTWNPVVEDGAAGERGLLQLHPGWWRELAAEMGHEWSELNDALVNMTVAYEIWRTVGPGEWSCVP